MLQFSHQTFRYPTTSQELQSELSSAQAQIKSVESEVPSSQPVHSLGITFLT